MQAIIFLASVSGRLLPFSTSPQKTHMRECRQGKSMSRTPKTITILGIAIVLGGGVVVNSPALNAQADLDTALVGDSPLATQTKVEDFHKQGVNRVQKKDYKGALKDFNKALQINPNFTEAYCDRGVARFFLGDTKGAIDDWSQTLQIDPNHAEAYDRRGNARSELGDYQGGIKDYTQAVQVDPNYAEAYYNRGLTQERLGRTHEAIQDYTQALVKNPNLAEAYGSRGLDRYKLGDKPGGMRPVGK